MDICHNWEEYEIKAQKITELINQSKNPDEKAELAFKLLEIEKDLTPCDVNDDPCCRLKRKIVLPIRRKTARTIIKLYGKERDGQSIVNNNNK